MATTTTFTKYYTFSGVDSGGTLSWFFPSNLSNYILDVTDVDEDGLADQGVDFWNTTDYTYSGYVIEHNGQQFAVFRYDPTFVAPYGSYYVPHNGELDDFPLSAGSTSATSSEIYVVNCFAAGTLIATPEGQRPIEELEIGDTILKQDGRPVPVRWIGRQAVSVATAGPRMQPVRLRAGCLGGGLPEQDLTVTADHGMVIDGLVVNASALVNGSTIDWLPASELPEQLTVYHVETEAHDVILANGVPTETFIDYRDRQSFDNYGEYLDLYGCERIIPEMPRPRISSRRQFPAAIRERLDQGIAAQRDDRETRRA